MYKAYSDGSTKNGRSGIGYIIYRDEQPIYRYRKRSDTHNSDDLEYIALTELLKKINELKIRKIDVFTDSQNIIDQLAKMGSGQKIRKERIKDIIYEKSIGPETRIIKIDSSKNKAHNLSRQAMQGQIEIDENLLTVETILKSVRIINNVVRYSPKILVQCHMCHEKKSKAHFPRRREKRGKQICSSCKFKLRQINNSYYKVKNTY